MKKQPVISLLLSSVMLWGSFALPASALTPDMTETVAVTQPATVPQDTGTVPQSAEPDVSVHLPFGQASIKEGCRTIDGMKPLAGSERRLATSQAAFAYEANSGTVIYSYNPDVKLTTGTLSKIVTALVAIENCEMDEVVTCSEGIQSKVPGSSQKVKPNLKSLEELSVEDLLHCLLLQSANDAAVALAEHVAGTTNAYVDLMNQWAQKHGCTSTEFGNISGLDTAVSFTTARDMARIMTEACENEDFVRISGTIKYEVPATNMAEARTLVTNNYMIDNTNIPQFLDTKVKAGLASTTDASGSSIAVMAEHKNMKLICVTMGALRTYDAEESWRVESYGNFNEMQELLEYLYSSFKVNQVLYDGQALDQFSVIGGESDVIGGPYVNYSTVLPTDCSMDNLYMKFKPVDGDYVAPIKKGDMIATVAITYRNSCIAEAEIYALNSVVSAEDSDVTVRSTAVRADNGGEGIMGFIGSVGILAVGGFGLYAAYNAYRRARRRIQRRRRRASRRRSY